MNRSPRRATFALSALMMALAGCATVDDGVQPPPQITTVGSRDLPASTRGAEGPLAPLPAQVAAVPAAAPVLEDPRDAAGMPVDPLSPDGQGVVDAEKARKDLWVRVRTGFGMPDLDNELVRQHERWYASRPDYVQRMTDRGSRYLYHIVEEVQRRGMPTELALLPFIESAFNPQALSTARASGMWQFMPLTGKDYDLKQNLFRDDRRDVLASTRAALDYLGRLNKMFNGDWQLALAAYNWGEGNVKRAIARNERAGLPTDYESLSMPAETRHYVPKFQAVKNIVLAPQSFGLALPKLENHPYFLSVPIRRDIDVAVAARLAGMPLEEFKALNPQMNKPVILAAGTPQILLPYNSADTFVKRLASHQGPLASWTAWVAPKTMKTAQAAELVGMGEAELREINRIPPKMLVKAGSTLLVQRAETRAADVPEHVADNAHMALAPDVPPLRKVAIQARKGDTVAALAKRYRVSANQIAAWNRIDDGTRFRKAQALVIWVPTGSKIAPVAEGRALAKAKAGKSVRMAAASPNRGGAAKGMKIRPTRLARK
ncbi:lytic transglycosylase catalytic subunit [Sphaerotilus natans subsp. natans DSM 6575]|uniref:Lytic transglycosylase catalytic subunit n=1 Tax=Sphaerotilus natans subsp. natans DSM 6575 TaxID=1286631 RepID=A0A059KQ23_9BURK|nr:transglycosylase SLT domain-containing protein [Sphaerotilus natans]KDB53577.1 lytic transglycosylase catalytic subunit [Sphaerotilus natans subsp. natans DSM 6575]SIR99261.1 membrane-bound lytic murein transglycosylase D [Sphaerotilus natans]